MAVKTKSCCFPHAGGDVSYAVAVGHCVTSFSPRRWGCFPVHRAVADLLLVFPTQVGMFLGLLLRACFSEGFPHAGGDVSGQFTPTAFETSFSPRRWGCFPVDAHSARFPFVFPTQVGMFLPSPRLVRTLERFPHAGGDVSQSEKVERRPWRFSPRRWGCF